jgi:hypothetical protein|tara:strand:+ start:51 stop:356 length:306 start_codon:yes stop_codon:yes gene_type:complete
MKQTVSMYQFERSFVRMGRAAQFTYEGLQALHEYFEEYEESTGEEIELDVIAICCEYSEYENLKEFQADYGKEYETREDIEEQTALIPVNNERGAFIIQQF